MSGANAKVLIRTDPTGKSNTPLSV